MTKTFDGRLRWRDLSPRGFMDSIEWMSRFVSHSLKENTVKQPRGHGPRGACAFITLEQRKRMPPSLSTTATFIKVFGRSGNLELRMVYQSPLSLVFLTRGSGYEETVRSIAVAEQLQQRRHCRTRLGVYLCYSYVEISHL